MSSRFYIPAPDQEDAQQRADALGIQLGSATLATDSRYTAHASIVPCVIIDDGTHIAGISDMNRTLTTADVQAAQDAVAVAALPPGIVRDTELAEALAAAELTPGPTGPQGEPGAEGAAGTAGAAGVAGEAGTAGAVGLTGEPGAAGVAGAAGAASTVPGPQGAPGADSTVAGPQGQPGSQGIAGTPGTPGTAGTQGIQGVPGAPGAQGIQGAQGPPGTTSHAALTDTGPNDHHAQSHAARHATGQPDALTAAAVGAATTVHAHVDGDLPAGLARDTEVAAAYAPTSHSHVLTDVDIPAAIARDAEVAAGYSPASHTHPAGITAGAIRKTTPQTLTATAQTPVTDMAFPVAANATYYFQMQIVVTTSTGTAPTTAWGFTGPAGVVAVGIAATADTSTSVQTDAVLTAFGAFAAGAQVANTGAKFCGVVQAGANAGTVQLTAARAGTVPSMVVAAGSNGLWVRVA